MLKVLQLHKDFEPLSGGGGTARHILGLSRALAGLGADVRIVAPAPERFEAPFAIAAAGRSGLDDHIAWADVVHIHGARSTYAAIGAVKSARAGKPFLYTPHAYYAGETAFNNTAKAIWDRTAERFMATRGAAMVLLTEVWRGFLRDRGIPTDRTVIIPNCVLLADLPLAAGRDAAPRLAGHPAILSVGRLDPVKRLGDTIRALARPELSEAHFHIVGKGPDRPALEALAAELGVASRVTFHGFVDDAGVMQMAAGADCFVLASEQEGLPTVLLEMLIARLPVVASDIPGNMAILNAAGLAWQYPLGDIAALAARLAASPALRVSDADVAAIKRAFTWEERAGEIMAIYTAAQQGGHVGAA